MADRLALRVLDDVCVDVHRDADLAVPKDLHHDARSHPGGGEDRGAAVPSIVQADHAEARGFGNPGEGAVDVPGLHRSAGPRDENMPAFLP